MTRKHKAQLFLALVPVLTLPSAYTLYAWDPVPVEGDPLVRMPGTQPNQVTLEAPNRCLNCHSGHDPAIEPGFNWEGSMMAQAARDFLFWACLTVAGQDSTWAIGRPNAVDICERCHFPKGWLEGRSDPTNASAMTGADMTASSVTFAITFTIPSLRAPTTWPARGTSTMTARSAPANGATTGTRQMPAAPRLDQPPPLPMPKIAHFAARQRGNQAQAACLPALHSPMH